MHILVMLLGFWTKKTGPTLSFRVIGWVIPSTWQSFIENSEMACITAAWFSLHVISVSWLVRKLNSQITLCFIVASVTLASPKEKIWGSICGLPSTFNPAVTGLSNKWTKTKYQLGYLHCIANFCNTVLNIF